MLSHDGERYVEVTLAHYRSTLMHLFIEFREKGFQPGETVLLAGIHGNNECLVAILFSALAAYGIRVLLPMFPERRELGNWVRVTGCSRIICPTAEIRGLERHEKEKTLVAEITAFAQQHTIPCHDSTIDFSARSLLHKPDRKPPEEADQLVAEIRERTDEQTEALVITTSGSSGASRLVRYNQGALMRSCLSWQEAGFFRKGRFAGPGFTPLLTHTMGIRSLFNALWSGYPVCLVITDWFLEKPEQVRYFLMKMLPEHITGGPATFRMLLELMRNFPELKRALVPRLKTIVSSGAAPDPELIAELETLFNTRVHNAFGTTETQQVLSTMLDVQPPEGRRLHMGTPLPGVRIRLDPLSGDAIYSLHVQSPFGALGIFAPDGKEIALDGSYATGDMVSLEDGSLTYVGRESNDFFKDGFGVKISLPLVQEYYATLFGDCHHIALYPLDNEPGLAAIIFDDKRRSTDHFTSLIETTNEQLFGTIDPFFFQHFTLRRYALVHASAPETAKGTVAPSAVNERYEQLARELTGIFPPLESITVLRKVDAFMDAYTRIADRTTGRMLRDLKMDLAYHRGRKDTLFALRDGKEIDVLDLTGGYGTNLLGHHHPEIVEAATSFLAEGRVSLSGQGSILASAGALAEKLNQLVGVGAGRNFRVRLASTGAEVVEMALHHACLEWRRTIERLKEENYRHFGNQAGDLVRSVWQENQPVLEQCRLRVVASASAFHGHSSAARALLHPTKKRNAFSNLLPLDPIWVDDQRDDWQETFREQESAAFVTIRQVVRQNGSISVETRQICTIAAALFEPVIGEGGIRHTEEAVLSFFSGRQYPLVLDEIQCGLGRTGSIPSMPHVRGDYYLFAKALGGGVEKVGALLIDRARYVGNFDTYYTSTFANGSLAAHVACKVLEVIDQDRIPELAVRMGTVLTQELEEVRATAPDVIQRIAGQGLMLGIHFSGTLGQDNILLGVLQQRKMLGYIFSSYLLHHHQIRIFPSLSASNVLRLEPSAYITEEEIARLCHALCDLVDVLKRHDMYRLFVHLMDEDPFSDQKGKLPEHGHFFQGKEPPAAGAVPVSFIAHFAYPIEELRALVPGIHHASDTGLRILFNRMQRLLEMKPVTLFSKNLFNNRIHFTFTVIPVDSAEMERRHREGNRKKVIARIQDAVDQAVARGSRVVSLGGFNSILTHNGMALAVPADVQLISGNTLTVASGLERILRHLDQDDAFPGKQVTAIIGATGNIGSILAQELIPRTAMFGELILVGRNRSQLETLRKELQSQLGGQLPAHVTFAIGMKLLKRCSVIINTTNTSEPLVFPHHISKDARVLIADNSVPAAVDPAVLDLPNVVSLNFASWVTLHQDPDLVVSSYTPKGTSFCCAAEAMLCGLEQMDVPLKGKISREAVRTVAERARKHRFFQELGTIQSFND